MNINKLIVIFGVIAAIVIVFLFIQFSPLNKNASQGKTSTVTIKDQTFSVTVAETEEEKQKGLSGLDNLPLDEGKLFVFEKPDTYSFWMKDMKFPIDIIYINGDKIVSITENAKPPAENVENPTCETIGCYQSSGPADKALEINAGLSKKYNFQPGDTVQIKSE